MSGKGLKRRLEDQFEKCVVVCKKTAKMAQSGGPMASSQAQQTGFGILTEPPQCPKQLSNSADLINVPFADPNSGFSQTTQYDLWESGNERLVVTLGKVQGKNYMGLTKFWRSKAFEEFKPTRNNIYMPFIVWEEFYSRCMEKCQKAELYRTSTRIYSMDRKLFKGVEFVGLRCEEEGTLRKSLYMTLLVLHLLMCHIWILSEYA